MFSTKNQKIISIILLGAILLSTMMSWFGGARGVQEIKGTIILLNPITILFVLMVIASLFINSAKTSMITRSIGSLGLVIMEIYYFSTWYLQTINSNFSLSTCFYMAYPEFYLSLTISCVLLIQNIILLLKYKNVDNE